MLLGVGWQSDLLPRIIALEERVHSLEIVLLTPTPETLPNPTPTPIPNLVTAINPNSSNVRIRASASLNSAILANLAPGASVLLCRLPTQTSGGLTWQRVASGGWIAIDYLTVTEQVSYGVCQ